MFPILITSFTFYPQKGVVIVPVADLVGQPLGSSKRYQQLPWAARGSDYSSCPRIHQLLFNEIVEIIDRQGNEIQVRVPNLFYRTTNCASPQADYWMLAHAIRPLDRISPHERVKFPEPIRFTGPLQAHTQSIVTLIAPYRDATTGITFSAGSRFVFAKQLTQKAQVAVYRFNPQRNKQELMFIPQKLLYPAKRSTPITQRAYFVAILRLWAHVSGGIPYVWGGCSFTNAGGSTQFVTVHTPQGGYYHRTSDGADTPKSGFDCSGLILRAAQIVGLSYFLKNSYTIAHDMSTLKPHEHLQNGDIIWIPRHVLVVSDIKNNLVVEAHAYGGGYGIVHELPISHVFKGIHSYKALEKALQRQIPLERLDRNKEVFATYQEGKLLSLVSSMRAGPIPKIQ